MFQIATWNVNSIRVRLGHVVDWLTDQSPDVLALQETKLGSGFPEASFQALGYHVHAVGEKAYNGVALISKTPPLEVWEPDHPLLSATRRLLCAAWSDCCVINAYMPNGAVVGSDKYTYKLEWLEAFSRWIQPVLKDNLPVFVVGDYNIAPMDLDVHDPEAWAHSVLTVPEVRCFFDRWRDLGLHDPYRMLYPDAQAFTWWHYRAGAFRRNHGLRIDHTLVSHHAVSRCDSVVVDPRPRAWDRPSDHAPVVLSMRSNPQSSGGAD